MNESKLIRYEETTSRQGKPEIFIAVEIDELDGELEGEHITQGYWLSEDEVSDVLTEGKGKQSQALNDIITKLTRRGHASIVKNVEHRKIELAKSIKELEDLSQEDLK